MTYVYVDTEFNGFGGDLISMALVSDDGDGWYGVLPLPEKVHPWVAENVVPKLYSPPQTREVFRETLHAFLRTIHDPHFIADSAIDIEHLCACMPGDSWETTLKINFVASVLTEAEPAPADPHNALSDAIALKEWHQAEMAPA